jgi:SAM-dependent methyltransferase
MLGFFLAWLAAVAPRQTPDIHYVPTLDPVVDLMLQTAAVTSSDVVYDLGSGDGRIVIAAAKKYGARGVGVELDPDLIKQATKNAQKAGVTDKVTFIQGDLFKADLSDAVHQPAHRAEAQARAQARNAHRLASLSDAAGLEAGQRHRRARHARAPLDDPLG